LTLVNMLGVALGKGTQNFLTAVKVFGLAAILVAGFWWATPGPPRAGPTPRGDFDLGGFALALIFVLWTYSGWHEGAYVAAEVRARRRNLPLALLVSTGIVMVLYVLVNAAYLVGLGYERAAMATAGDLLRPLLGEYGKVLVMVSALGAINGMIFTSAR